MGRFECCIGCIDRKAGCHGTCKEYLADKAEHEAERERIRQLASGDNDYEDFKVKTVDALRRRRFR